MRFHVMGSAAADGWPAVWCDCTSCERAWQHGGNNLRTRSGALIDSDLKIDLCPDTFAQALRDGLNLSKVRHILITHTHQDHFYPRELGMSWPPFSHNAERLHIWGNKWVIEAIQQLYPKWAWPETLHTLQAYEPVRFDDTTVLPLQAAHFPQQGAFNYIIQRNGKTVLYGLDSAWFPEDSWEAQKPYRFDLVVLDCTSGPRSGGSVHGDVDTVVKTRQRMLEDGTATEQTVFVANHFSHNGGLLHDELKAKFAPHAIRVAYDGMVIDC